MPMRKYKPEQIVTLLRQVEVELANGGSIRKQFNFLEKMVWVSGNEAVATLRDDLWNQFVNAELSIYRIIKEDEATDFEILITIRKIALRVFVSVISINVAKA